MHAIPLIATYYRPLRTRAHATFVQTTGNSG